MDILINVLIVVAFALASVGLFAGIAWAATADVRAQGVADRALIAQQYMDSVDYADVEAHLNQAPWVAPFADVPPAYERRLDEQGCC